MWFIRPMVGFWESAGQWRLMFVELYTCRLFVKKKISSWGEMKTLDDPMEIHLEVLGQPPGSLPDEWASVLDEELSKKLFKNAKSHYRNLNAGDRVIVVYRPDKGTEVWLNDKKQFTDPGSGLMRALLEQWVGERPVSVPLRQDLLGGRTR